MGTNWSDVFQVILVAGLASVALSCGICWTLTRAKKLKYEV